jgi:hypothetical protein
VQEPAINRLPAGVRAEFRISANGRKFLRGKCDTPAAYAMLLAKPPGIAGLAKTACAVPDAPAFDMRHHALHISMLPNRNHAYPSRLWKAVGRAVIVFCCPEWQLWEVTAAVRGRTSSATSSGAKRGILSNATGIASISPGQAPPKAMDPAEGLCRAHVLWPLDCRDGKEHYVTV